MIRCEADNIVMRNEMDKPLHEFLNLEVMCKCFRFPFLLRLSGLKRVSRGMNFFPSRLRKLNWEINEITWDEGIERKNNSKRSESTKG